MDTRNRQPQPLSQQGRRWNTRRGEKQRRLAAVAHLCDGPVLRSDRIVEALQQLLVSGDRVVLEGNNQSRPTSWRARWSSPTRTGSTSCT